MFTIEPKDLAAAVLAAGKEETRFYLCGVYFHATNDKIVLAATDGLSLIKIETGQDSGEDFEPFILGTDDIKIIMSMVKMERKTHGNVFPIELQFQKGIVKIGPNFKEYRFTPLDGTYPDYERAIPSQEPDSITEIGFNGNLFGTMQKAANIHADSRNSGLRVVFIDTTSPIRVYSAKGFTGVVMPYRV
jgi:DNA polymerase III sliding clamp (beta) subunit (PCNA family)